MRKIFILFILVVFAFMLKGQDIPVGTWRSHLNYSHTHLVEIYQHKIYAASGFGFFYFDTEDNSVNKLTKNDGFSDAGVSALATLPGDKGLIIGYKSGNIDILQDNTITNIDAIKDASIEAGKSINDIVFYNGLAYLATGFGLVALDYTKQEIRESYGHIGANGSSIAATGAAIWKDSIFLSTSAGVIATSLSPANNLIDFNNWRHFTLEEGIPEAQNGWNYYF